MFRVGPPPGALEAMEKREKSNPPGGLRKNFPPDIMAAKGGFCL